MMNILSSRQNAFREHNVQRRTDHRHEQPGRAVLPGWAKDQMKPQARAQRTLEGHNGNLPSALRASHTRKDTQTQTNTRPHCCVWWAGVDSRSRWWLTLHKWWGPTSPTTLCCSVLISIYHGNCSHRWGQRPGTHLPSFVCLWQGK